jgi:SAM-dependent methyltransferase
MRNAPSRSFGSTLRDDIQVLGVDLSARRLGVPQARRAAYERRLGRALNVNFLEQDVFSVLKAERFDLVWVMEAISHIDPIEKFLTAVFENLEWDGYLVISDSHLLNPAMAWRVFRLRRGGVELHTHKTTSAGDIVSYAQEQLFTIGQLSRMLTQTGFSAVKKQISVFFPPRLARFPKLLSFCTRADIVLNRIPLVRNLGGIYTIVASKQKGRV